MNGNDRLLDPLWHALRTHIGDDLLGHPLFFIVSVISTVVLAGLAFSLVDVFVTRKMPFRDAAKYLAVTLPGYLLVYLMLRYLPIETRWEVPTRAPTMLVFVRDFVICMVVGDVLSYWWHRLEHGSRFVFRNVHYVHHTVRSPLTVWSGFYVHPVESAVVFSTFYVYPFVVGVHPLVFGAYAATNTFITMVTHCGYDLPFYPNWLFASAAMHEHHHRGPRPTNFSVLLNFSDKLFGTFKPFSSADLDAHHGASAPTSRRQGVATAE